ncbi:11547_t:CDS:2 [Acaulospora colombiana]|uniref:11547_t:CDS:1 n=1 Tax=Acaulospora colombiana TaxID=27376 RepID=A0ACA9M7Q6_9GLOM|nr:11547_t:CDS:2 [Acaulospora colombiana]
MTFTETTQSLIETNDERRIQELIAASQKLLSQTTQPPTPTATATSGFNFRPEPVDQDKQQLRPRKPKTKASSENLKFGDASDISLPVSRNTSTPSLASMTSIPPPSHTLNNGNGNNNISSSNGQNLGSIGLPNSQGNNVSSTAKVDRKFSREKSEREMPMGPPEIMRDPTSDSFSSHAYSWPIVFAVIPPMVPWELYYAARSRRVMNDNINNADPAQEDQRNHAAKELRRHEKWALLLVIASPIIGGYALHGAKRYLTDYDKYISHFNIVLFVLAAGIRPSMHVISLAKNRTLHLQEQVHYPSTEVELLKRRVQHLEYEFSQLRRGFATKRDVINIKDDFEPTISQLNKAVRRNEKKEQYLRNYSEERFAYLENKLREFDTLITYKLQEEQAASLSRNMMQVMFLPLNITFTMFSYAKYILPRSLRGARQTPMLQPASNLDEDDDKNRLKDDTTQEISVGSLQKY